MKIHPVALALIGTLLAGSSGLQGAEPPFWDSNPNDAVRWEGRVAVKVINPSDFARPRELVAPKVGELGLPANVNANSLRVVDPQAAPDEPGEVGGNDLPCQVDDLDGDRKLSGDDELAFQLDLAPQASRTLHVYYSTRPGVPRAAYKSDVPLDLAKGTLANALVAVDFPTAQKEGAAVQFLYKGRTAAFDHWYYFSQVGVAQRQKAAFRSKGKVTGAKAICSGPVRSRVALTRQSDSADEPDMATFLMGYELCSGRAEVLHSMVMTPKREMVRGSYEFFLATEQPAKATHLFHCLEDGWRVATRPADTKEAYGRMSFPSRHPWLALEDKARGVVVALGAPPADVRDLQYALEFKRFELGRGGGVMGPARPLTDFAWVSFADKPDDLRHVQQAFERPVRVEIAAKEGAKPVLARRFDRPAREAEPSLPKPLLGVVMPAKGKRSAGVTENAAAWELSTSDMKVTVSKSTGAIDQIAVPGRERLLAQPGGVCLVRWLDKKRFGPAGKVSDVRRLTEGQLAFTWTADGLAVNNALTVKESFLSWEISIPNPTKENLLVEARLALPVALGGGPWHYWDGVALSRVDAKTRDAVMTTLRPGERASQGIFPSVCLHDAQAGIALGLEPLQIQSYYGSGVQPGEGPLDTFYYALRFAVKPGHTAEGEFVLYPVDAAWSWRSAVGRYYGCFRTVFEPPSRDDVWGYYLTSGPMAILRAGDTFIDYCRRMRVGGMQLYGPFNKTGDFYPDDEPSYVRGKGSFSREDMKRMYEVSNIACCTLSYVIPTKCERQMATTTYADSVIRQADGSLFLRDAWDVMGGGREKLAAMFAWDNSFGENLRRELRQIIDNYQPEGFYFDNGAFVWEDYGRHTDWSAFDDEGRIYTNGGIPYALIQDDVRAYKGRVHLNPGEFIQYFSGFRGDSHLTNVLSTQTHYVRTHRLIMGWKPIFVGHPRYYERKETLYDTLEVGGLPWLTRAREKQRLAAEFAPVAVALAKAGWVPMTEAAVDADGVRVERFGCNQFYTVRNLNEYAAKVTLTVSALPFEPDAFVVLTDFRCQVGLRNELDPAQRVARVPLTVPGEELVVLRAVAMVYGLSQKTRAQARVEKGTLCLQLESAGPQSAEVLILPPGDHYDALRVSGVSLNGKPVDFGRQEWPRMSVRLEQTTRIEARLESEFAFQPSLERLAQLAFLREAQPTSIVIPPDAGTPEQHTARRVKGFLELQAELLKKEKQVEIVTSEPSAKFPNRVHVRLRKPTGTPKTANDGGTEAAADIVCLNDHEIVLTTAMKKALWKLLDLVEAPFSQEPAAWKLCAPVTTGDADRETTRARDH